jgi:peptide/nickel transport system substrate-binding protein
VKQDELRSLAEEKNMSADDLGALIETHFGGELSRRQILALMGSASVSAFLLGSGIGASAQAAGTVWEKPPVNFVFVDTMEPTHLDPAGEEEFDAFAVIRNIYDPLVWMDERRGKLVPWLATSWKASPDATTYTFHLRPGVVFHDGSKLDAAAVKLNMDRYLAIGAPGEGYLLDDVASVSVVNSMTIRIKTKRPDGWLPAHLTKFPMLSAEAIKKHKTAKDPWAKDFFSAHAVGCGAYRLESWQHGVQLTLTKNKHWWHKWHPGSIDRVIIKPVSESSTRVELVESGQANFCTEWSVTDALSAAKHKGFKLHKYKTNDTNPIIMMNQQMTPLDNVNVRKAFQWAFDYAAMRRFFQGYSEPMNGPFPLSYPGVDKSLPVYKQDLPKARAFMTKAGVDPSSLNVTFMAPTGYADLIAGATITQASLQQLGVKVGIQQLPYGSLVQAYSKKSTAAMMTDLYNGQFTLDPSTFLSNFQPSSFVHAFTNYNSTKYNNLVTQIQETTKASKRDSLLRKVQHLLVDDAPAIWGGTIEVLIPVPNYLHGYVYQSTDAKYPCLFYLLSVAKH